MDKKRRTTANYGAFPITAGIAAARIQALEQQLASSLSDGNRAEQMKSELEILRAMYPQA